MGGEPSDAQCVAKPVTSTHPPDTHHWIGLALRCTHQRVDTPAAPEATLLQLCPLAGSIGCNLSPPLRLSFLLAATAQKVALFFFRSIAAPLTSKCYKREGRQATSEVQSDTYFSQNKP